MIIFLGPVRPKKGTSQKVDNFGFLEGGEKT